ncbi:MAG: hypothetical protein Q4E69_00470 [Bacilli bacterium]|nr:hypothetical protein [Bacilli bacterium]
MAKTHDQSYNYYYNKFKNTSVGDELKYDSDVVYVIIDLLKNLKNKLCSSDGNVKAAIDEKFKVLNGMQAISNNSTCTYFNVMSDAGLDSSVTKTIVQEMPGNIETLIGDLIKTLEDESQIMDEYITRCETAANIDMYRKFLSEHSEADYKDGKGPDGGLDYYLSIKQKVEDYDNNTLLEKLKNSKLFNKAIDKMMNTSEVSPKKSSSGGSTSAVSTTIPMVNNDVFTANTTTPTSQEVKINDVAKVDGSNTLKSTTETKNETAKTSSNIKNDMTNSATNSTTNKKTSTTQKSSIASGLTTSIKSAVSGKGVVNDVASATKEIAEKVESTAQDIAKEVKGTLASSINSFNNEKIKPLVKMTSSITGGDGGTTNKFIPPIAGVTAATVAGLGTKMYIDKPSIHKKKDDEDNKKLNEVEDEEAKKEEVKEEPKTLSKDDLIRILENKS